METLQAACYMLADVFKELVMQITPIRLKHTPLNRYTTHLRLQFNTPFDFKNPFHLFFKNCDASGLHFVSLAS